jgi:hypothetical protein
MGRNRPAEAMPFDGMVRRYLIIYSVNLLLLTNECQQRSSTDYALGVAHNTSRILARVNATLSPQLVGSASSDNSTPKCLSS